MQMIFLGEFGVTELLVLALLLIVPYFLPTIIAFSKGRKNKTAIFILNLLLGWTLLGWIACLVWACISDQQPQNIYITNTSSSENLPKKESEKEMIQSTTTSKYDHRLESLQKLKELLDSGVLSEEEFLSEKAKILSL